MAIADILETLGNENGSAVRLNELGKIKIGGLGDPKSSAGGGQYRVPVKHDYFTITTLNRTESKGVRGDLIPDTALMTQLLAAHGDKDGKLRQIPVRVLSNDIDDILQTAFVWYGRKSCGARSDGKTLTWFYNPQTMEKYDPPVTEDWKPEHMDWKDSKGNPLFKLHSVFNCVVAAKEARFGGIYKFRTTSLISFKQLYASLVEIDRLTCGMLIGMPLMLVLRPVQVSPEGKAITVHVVHCELRGSDILQIQEQASKQASWMLENRQRMLTVQNQYRKLLVAPGQEHNGETESISSEFHPEAQELEPAPQNYGLIDGEDLNPAASPQHEPTGPAVASPAAPESAASGGASEAEQEPHQQPEWPETLPDHARTDAKWIDDVILQMKPADMTARACRDAFHKQHAPHSWGNVEHAIQDALYQQLIGGAFVWKK